VRLPRAQIDNQRAGVIFIRDKSEFSIFGDCELLRVRPDVPAIDQLVSHWIDHAKSISALVRGRAIFVYTGRHSRRTAQRDKHSLPIRRRVNPAWPLAYFESRDNSVSGAVNHTDIARSFVADKNGIVLGFGTERERHANRQCAVNGGKLKFHALPDTSRPSARQTSFASGVVAGIGDPGLFLLQPPVAGIGDPGREKVNY